jgi:REP element-mobilizing transposase RayT
MVLLRKFNPEIHHRRSIRLKGYDYSTPGAYFITVRAAGPDNFFGTIDNGSLILNDFGKIVEFTWNDLPNHNSGISLDAFIIMPDHIHGIIFINQRDVVVGAGSEPAPTNPVKFHGLPEIIRQFKTFSARRINVIRKTPGTPVWQRNYYEHIIRSDPELNRIQRYIINNPSAWASSPLTPRRKGGSQTRPDGSQTRPDGSQTRPDGSVTTPTIYGT